MFHRINSVFAVAAALLSLGASRADEPIVDRQPVDRDFHRQLDQLATRCEEWGLAARARETRQWAVQRDPHRQYLFPRGNARRKSPPPESKRDQQWRGEFMRIRREQADDLFQLARRASDQGRATQAFQLLHEVLREDPDHREAARILGIRRSPRPSPPRARPGRVKHARFGWARNRYWWVETPHFRVTTSHGPPAAVELAGRLEELHSVWRQLFFRYWSTPRSLAERFAGRPDLLGRPRKYNVVLFRDAKEYVAQLKAIEPRIAMSLGYYAKDAKTAFFYAGEPSLSRTWLHEVTHQLFQEADPAVRDVGERSNFWVVEGLAIYLESMARHDGGYLSVGGFDADRLQYARSRCLGGEECPPTDELVTLGRQQMQSSDQIGRLYTRSAGLVHCLMDHEQGRYRRRFVDFLRSVYQGRDGPETLSLVTGESFERLDELYVEFLRVDDRDLEFLSSASKIHNLSLAGTRVTDAGVATLSDMTHLEWIDLSFTGVTDEGIKRLARLPRLRQLDLAGTAVTDEALKVIAALERLEELDLSGTRVGDEGVARLAGASQLKMLWLAGTAVTDRTVNLLQTLDQLRRVDVSGTAVSEAAWEAARNARGW